MLARIRQLFDPVGAGTAPEPPSPALAAAALLVEVARADYHVDDEETRQIAGVMRDTLGLAGEELESLLELAHEHSRDAVGLHPFTSVVHERFGDGEKRELFVCLWRVAFADGRIDKYEEHLLRRIADLLHVPHRDFIRTRLEVEREIAARG